MLPLPGLTIFFFLLLVKVTNIRGSYLGNYINVAVQVTQNIIGRKAINSSGHRIFLK